MPGSPVGEKRTSEGPGGWFWASGLRPAQCKHSETRARLLSGVRSLTEKLDQALGGTINLKPSAKGSGTLLSYVRRRLGDLGDSTHQKPPASEPPQL